MAKTFLDYLFNNRGDDWDWSLSDTPSLLPPDFTLQFGGSGRQRRPSSLLPPEFDLRFGGAGRTVAAPQQQVVRQPEAAATSPLSPPPEPPPVQTPPIPMQQGVFPYGELAWQIGQETGVPAALILAIIDLESGGNPQAISPDKEHLGLGQVASGWFGPGDDPFDPATNIRAIANVLLTKFIYAKGDKSNATWRDAVARYYGGTLEQPARPLPGVPGPDTLGYVTEFDKRLQKYRYVYPFEGGW